MHRLFPSLTAARAVAFALTLFALAIGPADAQSVPVRGQTLYLPVYSHIWHGEVDGKGQPAKVLVSVLVSVRNTDPAAAITLTAAQYFDTEGKRIKEYLAAPRVIPPLGTYELYVPTSDDSGGSGANFILRWKAANGASPPIVEALHANLPAGRAIVFLTSARVVASE
ncbi:MAG TPA: DUF3124 domain-containing protein [Burkholderiales bacterium]